MLLLSSLAISTRRCAATATGTATATASVAYHVQGMPDDHAAARRASVCGAQIWEARRGRRRGRRHGLIGAGLFLFRVTLREEEAFGARAPFRVFRSFRLAGGRLARYAQHVGGGITNAVISEAAAAAAAATVAAAAGAAPATAATVVPASAAGVPAPAGRFPGGGLHSAVEAKGALGGRGQLVLLSGRRDPRTALGVAEGPRLRLLQVRDADLSQQQARRGSQGGHTARHGAGGGAGRGFGFRPLPGADLFFFVCFGRGETMTQGEVNSGRCGAFGGRRRAASVLLLVKCARTDGAIDGLIREGGKIAV